jgi:predicted O-methyltransferase YrrM
MEEPTSAEEVRTWVEQAMSGIDLFARVAAVSDEHRAEHGCYVYRTSEAPLLGVLAGASGGLRLLEVGTGLGYSALWIASGAPPAASLLTIEKDPTHARIARSLIAEEGYADKVQVREGGAEEVLPDLQGPYDFVFYDADIPGSWELEEFSRLVRPGGLLATSNLFLGRFDPNLEGLDKGTEYRQLLLADSRWRTAFTGNWMAVSLRR